MRVRCARGGACAGCLTDFDGCAYSANIWAGGAAESGGVVWSAELVVYGLNGAFAVGMDCEGCGDGDGVYTGKDCRRFGNEVVRVGDAPFDVLRVVFILKEGVGDVYEARSGWVAGSGGSVGADSGASSWWGVEKASP